MNLLLENTNIMLVSDLKALDYLVGLEDSYIVLDIISDNSFYALNKSTMESEFIEGDYLSKGDISHFDFTNKGNIFDHMDANTRCSEEYKNKLKTAVQANII